MSFRVAADIGGTFTDLVSVDDDGQYHYMKLTTTPDGFERAVYEGIGRLLSQTSQTGANVDHVMHATTVATNAILERSGPKTGLLTTRGFRDVLEIGRLRIPNSYDLFWTKPLPLAHRRHRVEVDERVDSDGTVVLPIDRSQVEEAVAMLHADGITAIAISFLNSYANNVHEGVAAALIHERFPDIEVTAGTELVPEPGEYERTSTAVINAYLRPVVSEYLGRLVQGLEAQGVKVTPLVMQSSGGMMPVADAREHPVHILESGPAAGAVAASRIAERSGLRRVVAFDMGGTTAKATLIEDFELKFGSDFAVGAPISAMSRLLRGGGYAVRLPSVDLAEVGAGGGSIARVDAANGLEVGPQSSGAVPGPACYSKGGTLPTVTDANLVLGYVSPEGLRGSGIAVDLERARRAMADEVGRPLGLEVEAASEAVHVVADQRMAQAIRAVSTERGRDLADYALVAYGGSGPAHAASLAQTVGIRMVLVPPLAGVLSAVGLLWSPIQLTEVESFGCMLAESVPALEERRAAAERRLRQRMASVGYGDGDVEIHTDADLRYVGQAYDLAVRLPAAPLAAGILRQNFEGQHTQTYGHAPDAPVELTRLRVSARVVEARSPMLRPESPVVKVPTSRSAIFAGRQFDVVVLTRDRIQDSVTGPCMVDDPDTTTVVPPGWSVRRDDQRNLVLERLA